MNRLETTAEEAAAAEAAQDAGSLVQSDKVLLPAPTDARLLFNLGRLALSAHDIGRAETAFRDALESDPNHSEAIMQLADLYENSGRPHESAAILRSLVEGMLEKLPDLLLRLGAAEYQSGNLAQAESTLRRLAGLEPDMPDAHILLSDCVDRLGRPEEAIVILRRASARPSSSVELLRRLGAAATRQGFNEEAARAYNEALKAAPHNHAIAIERVLSLANCGRKQKAAGVLKARIAQYPDVADLHWTLGNLIESDDAAGARSAFARVLALDPEYPGAVAKLASLPEMRANSGPLIVTRWENGRLTYSINVTSAKSDGADQPEAPGADRIPDQAVKPIALEAEPVVAPEPPQAIPAEAAAATPVAPVAVEPAPEPQSAQPAPEPDEPRISDIRLNFALGINLLKQKDYKGAAEALEAVARIDEDYAGVSAHLLRALRGSGRVDDARALFARRAAAERGAMPASLLDGMMEIEAMLGLPKRSAPEWLAQGLLPSRALWSKDQKRQWGRAASGLIKDIVSYDRMRWAEVARFTGPSVLDTLNQGAAGGRGAVLITLHSALAYHAIGALDSSGLPYRISAEPDELLMAFDGKAEDMQAEGWERALERLSAFIAKGGFVLMGGDSGRSDQSLAFVHAGETYSLAGRPLQLAYHAKARVYFMASLFDGSRIRLVVKEGPRPDSFPSQAEWTSAWLEFFRAQMADPRQNSPENWHFCPSYGRKLKSGTAPHLI
jgi:tetratricopeptide (TPR) repeat protein